MRNQPKKRSSGSVRVHYPHPGQRFVDVCELLNSPKAREQIDRMAKLDTSSNSHREDEPSTQ